MSTKSNEIAASKQAAKNFQSIAAAVLRSPVLVLAVAAGIVWFVR